MQRLNMGLNAIQRLHMLQDEEEMTHRSLIKNINIVMDDEGSPWNTLTKLCPGTQRHGWTWNAWTPFATDVALAWPTMTSMVTVMA